MSGRAYVAGLGATFDLKRGLPKPPADVKVGKVPGTDWVTISYNAEWKEYLVSLYRKGKRYDPATAYTPYKDDAYATALAMAKQSNATLAPAALRFAPGAKFAPKRLEIDGNDFAPLVQSGYRLPDENVILYGPFPPIAQMVGGYPPGTFMLYVFKTAADKDAHVAHLKGGGEPVLFKHGHLGMDFSPISEVWGRRAASGMIGMLRVVAYDPKRDGGEEDDHQGWAKTLYIDMMTVRPTYQRNKLNAAMILTVMSEFPGRRLGMSKPTFKGSKFLEWMRSQGHEVTVF